MYNTTDTFKETTNTQLNVTFITLPAGVNLLPWRKQNSVLFIPAKNWEMCQRTISTDREFNTKCFLPNYSARVDWVCWFLIDLDEISRFLLVSHWQAHVLYPQRLQRRNKYAWWLILHLASDSWRFCFLQDSFNLTATQLKSRMVALKHPSCDCEVAGVSSFRGRLEHAVVHLSKELNPQVIDPELVSSGNELRCV